MGNNYYHLKQFDEYSVSEDIATYYKSNSLEHKVLDMAIQIKKYIKEVLTFNGLTSTSIPGEILNELPKALNFSVGEFSPMLGVSKSKYYRIVEESSLPKEIIDKLSSILNLYQLGVNTFDGQKDEFNTWLHMENANLGKVEPYKLLSTEVGRKAVSEALHRIEYNLYG